MIYQREKVLNDILFFFFALFVFSSAFSIAISQISLGISLFLFIVIIIIKHYQPFQASLRWVYIFIGLYIFWMLVAALAGKTPLKSVLMIKEEWLFLIIPIGIYLFNKENYRQKLIIALAIGVGLISFYGILQHFIGLHWFKSKPLYPAFDYGYRSQGTFSHPLTFGNYYATASAFFCAYLTYGWRSFSAQKRIYVGVVSLLSVLVTLFSYSRGSILGLLVALFVLGVITGKKKIIASFVILLMLSAIIVAVVPKVKNHIIVNTAKEINIYNEAGRFFIWDKSLKIIRHHPIFGVGQGNFYYEYLSYLRKDIPDYRKLTHAHDDFLNIAAISGIPGMIFFIGMWLAVFVYLGKGIINGKSEGNSNWYLGAAFIASVAFLITSITEATFADEEVRQLLMFIWAVGLWQQYSVFEKKTGTERFIKSKNS
ncbi:MAG: O-antigen ligase family protein [FCB group bacterium]|nr:O-antigen ligase family protein [FCB group bacterium]